MNIELYTGNAEILRTLFVSRKLETQEGKFGLEIDDDKYVSDIQKFLDDTETDMLVLFRDTTPIGYFGIEYFISPLSHQKLANDQSWYVMKEHRGIGSIRLYKMAEIIAKEKGCSHLIMNASMMASEMHDQVCKLYEKLDMSKFETSYIKEL